MQELGIPFGHAHEDADGEGGFRPCELTECLDAGVEGLFVTPPPAYVHVGPPPVDAPEGSAESESWKRATRFAHRLARPSHFVPLTDLMVKKMLRAVTPRSAG